jgi:hypothetical protein
MAAISKLQRIVGLRHAWAPPGTGMRGAVAIAAGKAPLPRLEGASEEIGRRRQRLGFTEMVRAQWRKQ